MDKMTKYKYKILVVYPEFEAMHERMVMVRLT